jgi:DNA-binding SARP family transcriptional activator
MNAMTALNCNGYPDEVLDQLPMRANRPGCMLPCCARRLRAGASSAPSPSLGRWAYPVRILTLGQWAVEVQGQVLHFTGKAQRRPLFLLQGLLARGGRPVAVNLLRKALGEAGEERDGHYSRGAFDMALSRLRHLLPVPDLLQLSGGTLGLNESLCWVDAWACERLLLRADQSTDAGLALFERALRLYEGEFLPGEDSAGSVLARERLRSRLLRIARRLGQALETRGRWDQAGGLYERLREHFPLDEDLCLHLIRSHIRRDQFAQANSLYGRCRDTLVKVLGVLPSPAIKALLQQPA